MNDGEHPLEYLFHPRSVAVVGASTQFPGNQFVASLLQIGFPGPIYPVNPKAEEIMGLRCYPTLQDIPYVVDHVISNVPAQALHQIVEDCGAKKVRSLHLFTSGFSESGEADRVELQRWLAQRARELGIRVIGPNCMGLYVPSSKLTFTFGFPTEPGPVAFISQSGANAGEFVFSAAMFGVRFSKVISYGNAIDLDESDFFDYCADDPETEAITSYIEGVKNGKRFFKALKKAASRKPVAILKGGRTEAGGRAAYSHTASLAGSAKVFETLCRQTGAIQVDTLEELADMAMALRFVKSLPGPRAAVVMAGGGRSVLSADELTLHGLEVPALPSEAQEALRRFTPIAGTSVRNPIDTIVAWFGGEQAGELTWETIRIAAEAPNVDFVLWYEGLQWGPPTRTGGDGGRAARMEGILHYVIERVPSLPKPLIVALRPAFTPEAMAPTYRFLDACAKQGIAVFPDMSRAARVLGRLWRWQQSRAE